MNMLEDRLRRGLAAEADARPFPTGLTAVSTVHPARGARIALAAAAVVLVGVGGFSLATRYSSALDLGVGVSDDVALSATTTAQGSTPSQPPASSVTSSAALPEPTAVPFTVGEFSEADVPEGTSTERAFVTGAVATDFGTVVIGYHLEVGPMEPLAWVSSSASDWRPIDLTLIDKPGMSTNLTDVIATADGVAILGVRYEEDTDNQRWEHILLTSTDAREWTLDEEVTSAEALELGFVHTVAPFGNGERVDDVARFGSMLVAAGSIDGDTPVVFVSTDEGTTWDTIASEAFAVANESILALAVSGSRIVAIGEMRLPEGPAGESGFLPVFWSSTNGIDWQQIDDPESFGIVDDRPLDIAAAGSGFVAYGVAASGDAGDPKVLWTSPDGQKWERRVVDDLSDRIIHHIWVEDASVTLFAATQSEPNTDQFGPFEIWTASITEE